jgi:beta-N-acetylhexosaminidase
VPWKVTVRTGPRVQRIRFAELRQALDAAEARARELADEAPRRDVGAGYKRFTPVEQVAARIELAGPERLLPSKRAGLDVRGDGSTEAYIGRVRRQVVEQKKGETAYAALRRVLLAAALVVILGVCGSTSAVARPIDPVRALKRPHIVWDPIPFGARRKAETVAYVRRHYGSFMKPTWRLRDPHVIVIHFTDSATFSSAYNTFAADVPDQELHELPGTCAHFIVDSAGTIHQLVSLGTICRHTVGLNWTAVGIEHVGFSDQQILGDHRQLQASLHLVHWLSCRFHILVRNVIGHNESLSSPYHHEDVVALRHQTHDDWSHADMQIYRAKLRRLGGC